MRLPNLTPDRTVTSRSVLLVGLSLVAMAHPARLSLALALALAGCTTTNVPEFDRPGTAVPSGQDLRLAAYNVAYGAVVGGVGALVNGREDPPLWRLARGAGRGALGGTALYAGKLTAGQVSASESFAWAWPAVLLHSAGTSVVENAAHDRPPLDRLTTRLGFIRLDVRPSSGDVQARLLPVSAAVFASVLVGDNGDLDLGRSLAFGTPVFVGEGSRTAPVFGGQADGYGGFGTVYLNRDNDDFYGLAAHELIHVLQHREGALTSALYGPLDEPLRQSGAYRTLARWVYLDEPVLPLAVYYLVAGGPQSSECYFNNWFEREAEAFGRRVPVGVCP